MQKGTDWGGTYSRFSFDEMKRYVSMLKEQGKVVLDDEFNVAQEILHTLLRRTTQDGWGDGAVGDGWKVVGTGAANNFTITGGNGTAAGAGRIYVNGIMVMLPSNITYSAQEIAGPALTTPAGARTDEVYLDVWLDEYGPADDAAITDPTLGTETSRRLRVMYMVRVAEGGVTPANYNDATGITHYTAKIATLSRTATSAINAGMVADERPRLAWDRANIDYVLAQASITPQRKLDTQLYDAIAYLITLLVPPVPVATTDVQGKVELATDAETQAGTDTARAVTPSSLFAAAVAAATANRIVRRDAAGRAQVVAPSAANDIAIKSNVDAVQTSVDNHATATTGVHGVGGSTVESAAGAQAKVDALLPSGTRLVFHQSSAPTGWTLDASKNDRVLRVNSAGGGGVGGAWAISGLTHSHNHYMDHTHESPVRGTSADGRFWQVGDLASPGFGTGPTRSGQTQSSANTGPVNNQATALTSGASMASTNDANVTAVSSNGSWRPAYTDIIIAQRN
jgi:hypothetical protein